VRLYLDPDESMAPAKSLGGTPASMIDTARRWQEIGVDHIVLDLVVRGGIERRVDELKRFRDEVASKL
jgi:hypothetical protein